MKNINHNRTGTKNYLWLRMESAKDGKQTEVLCGKFLD